MVTCRKTIQPPNVVEAGGWNAVDPLQQPEQCTWKMDLHAGSYPLFIKHTADGKAENGREMHGM